MRAGEPLILWDWTFNHLPDIAHRVQEHLVLTGIAVGVGFVLAFAVRILPSAVTTSASSKLPAAVP